MARVSGEWSRYILSERAIAVVLGKIDFMLPPTARFSNRVADYVRYRPGYPADLIPALERLIGLQPNWRVADIGSGTGKLSELFLTYGCELTGIEPNREMRLAAVQTLSAFPRFVSVDATAESTGLADASVDLVTAGQAFHWFDPAAAKAEFKRILAADGWVALIWNDRFTGGTPLLEAYEQLLRTLPEYLASGHKTENTTSISAFFESEPLVWKAPNRQEFDWEGLCGRALSSSYVPKSGDREHAVFMKQLRDVFDDSQVNGSVTFLYETQMFVGKL